MRSMFSNAPWRAHGARFLKRNCAAGAKTTDEKAAEVSKEAWPSLRKYSPIWVPIVLVSILAIDVVNNTHHRNVIEPYMPTIIQAVRDHIGFDDEDPEEIRRVKETIKAQGEPLSALIVLSSGVEIVEDNVDGDISYGDFYQKMQLKYSTEGQILKITFLNKRSGEDKDSIDTHSSGNDEKKDDKTDKKKKREKSEELEYTVANVVNSPLGRSSWEGDETIPSSSSSSIKNSSRKKDSDSLSKSRSQGHQSAWSTAMFGTQKSESDSAPLNRSVMVSKFEGVLSTVLSDWKYFGTIQNPNILVINGESGLGESRGKNAKQAGGNREKYSKLMEKEEVKMAIVSLESQILELRNERKRGTREIDQIDMEIQRMNTEITRLKRTYLNYFYFF